MSKQPIYMFRTFAAALTLGLAVCSPIMAMGGYSGDQVGKGLIQSIDYQHHTITVNGQTYAVSPHAKFGGVASFSVLSIGMPVQFMLGSTVSTTAPSNVASNQNADQSEVIVGITWLPGGAK